MAQRSGVKESPDGRRPGAGPSRVSSKCALGWSLALGAVRLKRHLGDLRVASSLLLRVCSMGARAGGKFRVSGHLVPRW